MGEFWKPQLLCKNGRRVRNGFKCVLTFTKCHSNQPYGVRIPQLVSSYENQFSSFFIFTVFRHLNCVNRGVWCKFILLGLICDIDDRNTKWPIFVELFMKNLIAVCIFSTACCLLQEKTGCGSFQVGKTIICQRRFLWLVYFIPRRERRVHHKDS